MYHRSKIPPMSTAMPQLRPMGVGDILDQAVRIYRQNMVTMVEIVAIVSVPVLLVQVAITALTLPWSGDSTSPSLGFDSSEAAVYYITQFVTGVLAAIGALFQTGALAVFISERYLGRTITVRKAYARTLRRWPSLLIGAFLFGLAASFTVAPFAAMFLAAAVTPNASTAATAVLGLFFLGACVLSVPVLFWFFFLSTRWLFYVQAIVLENYNSTGGLGRSWKLVKGFFWRTFAFYLILAILVLAFSAGPIFLLQLGSFLVAAPALSRILTAVAQTLFTILLTPIQLAALTLYYYDLRIRKEGLDLQMQLRASRQGETSSSEAAPFPSGVIS